MLKNNTDILCSCSNYSSMYVKMIFAQIVGDHKYINGKTHKLFASLGTLVVE